MPKSSSKGSKRGQKGPHLADSKTVTRKPKKQLRKAPKALTRKEEALRRFVVSPDELARTPQITDMLKNAFKSVKTAIDAVRFSNETSAIEFLRVYDEIPAGDRDYVPVEAICLKAGVPPSALLGAMFLACKDIRGKESALIAVNAHPEVLKSTIEYALLPGGDRDRKMLHESIGFLPTPKGGNINVNLLNGNPQYQSPDKVVQPDIEEDFGELFPSVTKNLEQWSENRRNKLLSDGG